MSTTRVAGAPSRSGGVAPSSMRPGVHPRTRLWRGVVGEWTAVWGLRSTPAILLLGATITVAVSALTCWLTGHDWGQLDAAARARFDPVTTSLQGVPFGQLAFGVLGVLTVSRDYATRAVDTVMVAEPRRWPVVVAKLAVVTAITGASALLSCVVAFLIGQRLLDTSSGLALGVGIGADHVGRAVLGAAAYVTAVALTGIAMGYLLRSTAAAVVAVIGTYFVLPTLVGLFPHAVSDAVAPWLPSRAGAALWAPNPQGPAPALAFATYCGYVVLLLALAVWRLRRSDV